MGKPVAQWPCISEFSAAIGLNDCRLVAVTRLRNHRTGSGAERNRCGWLAGSWAQGPVAPPPPPARFSPFPAFRLYKSQDCQTRLLLSTCVLGAWGGGGGEAGGTGGPECHFGWAGQSGGAVGGGWEEERATR